MIRYRLIHPVALLLCTVAMRFDWPWLFELSGSLELYADECGTGAR